MLLIVKDTEPDALREDREDGNSFEGRRCKIELRNALLRNQGHLCVYCMKRIELGVTRDEHYMPRRYTHLLLDYNNLFLACQGNEGTQSETCDVKKKDRELRISPLNPNHISNIYYTSGGEISSNIQAHKDDINDVLNLNEDWLTEKRRVVFDVIYHHIRKARDSGNISFENLESLLEKYETKIDEKLMPFCGVAIWFINKTISEFT